MDLRTSIIELYNDSKREYSQTERQIFTEFVHALNLGVIRSCEKTEQGWSVNQWVKMGILLGFRMGSLTEHHAYPGKSFFEKNTMPEKLFTLSDQVRIVPGGSSIRTGAYIAPGVTIMPPSYINIGAWVDSGTMVDSHALVGSCAQIGKRVHLSAGAMVGGVLEPIGTRPVIIEDDAFIGGNSGIYEGIIISERVVLSSGTIINASTPIYDSVNQVFLPRDSGGSFTIPPNAVVVPGSRALKTNPAFQIYCPIIIKYRDQKTDAAVVLERELRHIMD
jgi:2,3,4,5-tetrahydropyridine-2-carboxylate N-succinyltransferase